MQNNTDAYAAPWRTALQISRNSLQYLLANVRTLFWISVLCLTFRATLLPEAILMSDEYYYAQTSRLWFEHQQETRSITNLPNRGESGFPNYLFFAIYRYTFFMGDNFYIAAKLINVVFAVMIALLVGFVARRFTEKDAATMIAAMTLWLPSTSYYSYFAPEPLYECLVWFGLAAFFYFVARDIRISATAMGGFLGLAMLAKLNALALLGGVNVVVLIAGWYCLAKPIRLRQLFGALLGLNLAFLIVGYLSNIALTGHLVWDPLGSFYRSSLTQVATIESNLSFIRDFAKYAFAYCFVILLVFGPAVVILAAARGGVRKEIKDTALIAMTAVGLATLLLGSSKVAVNWERVYVDHIGVYSTRYIHVLFPLLVIAFVRFFPEASQKRSIRAWTGAGISILCVILAFAYHDMANYFQMREVIWNRFIFPAFVAGLVSLTLYFAWARRPRMKVYTIALGLYVLMMSAKLFWSDHVEINAHGIQYGNAARVVASIVPPESYDKGYLISDLSRWATRFMFRFPGIVPLRLVDRGAVIARNEIPDSAQWVIFIGDVYPESASACITMESAVFCPLSSAGKKLSSK